MRVGFVIYGSLATVSGGYLYDRMLVKHLRQNGHTVEIISLPWRTYPHHLGDNLSRQWLQRLCELEIDVLLQDELNYPSLFLINRLLAPWCRYPLVSIVHHLRSDETHPPLLQMLYWRVERAYLRSVDGAICNSKTTRGRVLSMIGTRSLPNLVAYPAADHLDPPSTAQIINQIGERTLGDGPIHILFIGNLIRRKALHTLLDAVATLPKSWWRLHVIGNPTMDPVYTEEIHALIRTHQLCANVTLAGSVATDQLRRTLEASHLLVVPSFEGFGIVYLEAMAYGLPVIATTAGAARELVVEGETGYLIRPGDVATLSIRISRLHQNRPHLATMSFAARRRYATHPTWQQSTSSIATWLQENFSNRS